MALSPINSLYSEDGTLMKKFLQVPLFHLDTVIYSPVKQSLWVTQDGWILKNEGKKTEICSKTRKRQVEKIIVKMQRQSWPIMTCTG